jgi:CheY-like chemotaxis protein
MKEPSMRAATWESLNPRDASVMVVEDNEDDARVITRVLQNLGIRQLSVVATGEEAISRAIEEPYDVVLTDVGLLGMDGLGVLKQMTQLRPETKVIVLTGMGNEQTAVAAMKLGASDYICKDELFTSGIVNSLQAALHARVATHTAYLEQILEAGTDRLELAEAEAEWLILYDLEDHGYRARPPLPIEEGEVDDAQLQEMMRRYLELREFGFQGPTLREEEGLVTAFVTRGMSPRAMVSLYRSSIQAIRERKQLDGSVMTMNPTASFVRVLSRVIEEYQYQVSATAMGIAQVA